MRSMPGVRKTKKVTEEPASIDELKETSEETKEKRSYTSSSNTDPYGVRLIRSESDRVIAGVCGGLGNFFRVDSTIVRLAFVLLTLFGGSGLVIYIILWIIMPSEKNANMPLTEDAMRENIEEMKVRAKGFAEDIRGEFATRGQGNEKNNSKLGGFILLLIGLVFLLQTLNVIRIHEIGRFWPLVLVFIGLFLLFRNDK